MRKKLVIFASMLCLLCGCSAEATENNLSGIHYVKAKDEMGDKTQEERAHAIKRRLQEIQGISGNAVVIEGHTAIIGLRLEDGMENEAARLRREAHDAAKEADEYVENTSITTNGRIVAIIEEMERQRAN